MGFGEVMQTEEAEFVITSIGSVTVNMPTKGVKISLIL
jgi:hypothetical protein